VPLTRIRDIAHRNDIPSDLKAEIKHTLQNKLHRNAGPEDLVAAELMLARVTAPGANLNGAFVDEFRVFVAELRDFFNAASLTDTLGGLRASLDDPGAADLERFLAAKAKLDGAGAGADANTLMEVLHALTSVRSTLVAGLRSGLRNDASDGSMAMRQRWRLAEVRCEDYFFVLLSRFLNGLEAAGGAEHIAGGGSERWALPLGAAVLSLRHTLLSGWEQAECLALDQELAAWQSAGRLTEAEGAARLRASLERLQRLTQGYADALLTLYAGPAEALGRALGVAEHAARVFTESEVRASIMLQAARLCALLVPACRRVMGASAWDAVVAGTARGKLLALERITPEALASIREDVVLLVAAAEGDEEVAWEGRHVRGVILCHELPHLSHLGASASRCCAAIAARPARRPAPPPGCPFLL